MSRNLELKARIPSLQVALETAKSIGAQRRETLEQRDTYFVVPYGRLKLREEGKSAELIYYERAEKDEERWSHYSKFPVADPAGIRKVFSRAFGVLIVVRKTRLLFLYHHTRIHLDNVDKLGTFLEFEVKDSDDEESRREMELLRAAFSINQGSAIRASYADLLAAISNPE